MAINSYKKRKTNIDGVSLLFNKVVGDDRGYFLDLAETDNPAVKTTKHIHSVLALQENKSRGEHYHYKLTENFYTISGTSLCCLYDFNEKSFSYGKVFAFISGNKPKDKNILKISEENKIKTFFIEDNYLVQAIVPPMVWHAWWKLTDENAVIVSLGDRGYDEKDYAKPKASEIKKVKKILDYYEITT